MEQVQLGIGQVAPVCHHRLPSKGRASEDGGSWGPRDLLTLPLRRPHLVSEQVVSVIHVCVGLRLREKVLHQLDFLWVLTDVALRGTHLN